MVSKPKRGRPKLAPGQKRDRVLSIAVTPETLRRLTESAANEAVWMGRKSLPVSTHIADILDIVADFEHHDLRRVTKILSASAGLEISDLGLLVEYCRVLRAATEAAGDDPGLWARYAAAVPFPPHTGNQDFQRVAKEKVAEAVQRAFDTYRWEVATRNAAEPPPFEASPDLKKALRDAEYRHAHKREATIRAGRAKATRKDKSK